MKKNSLSALACGAALVILLMGIMGCDETNDQDTLTLSPDEVTLTATNYTATFTATLSSGGTNSLALPLEWSVTDGSRGRIVRSSGSTAVYTGFALGDNIVIAKDQYSHEGYATVHQVPITVTTITTADLVPAE